ncbi:hypothetical protein [Sulfitobacter pacificus]|uniref:hypothetical protein n=1 Tax=Sulfitobacter pacificus TaxID=1499314 RepID=UPI003108F271
MVNEVLATLDAIENAFSKLAPVVARLRDAIRDAVQKVVKAAAAWISAKIERDKRIARIIAHIPQHLRGNPMCRDPWHRGIRA